MGKKNAFPMNVYPIWDKSPGDDMYEVEINVILFQIM